MSPLTFHLSAALTVAIFGLGLVKVLSFLYDQLNSPLRDLPGPDDTTFFYGDLKET
jgi:hypothetical protein